MVRGRNNNSNNNKVINPDEELMGSLRTAR
jgi:hypothetical protein